MKEKPKLKKNINLIKYIYYIVFIAVIIIEVYLIIFTSNKIDEKKIILSNKLNRVVNKKNNISKLIIDNEKLKKEIDILKDEQMNSLQICKNENEKLMMINKNISDEIHKNYEEFELRKKLLEYKIDEDNETLIELKKELNNKSLIMENMEKELDKLEEKIYTEIPDIKIKSSIIEFDEEKINLITKWLTSLNIGQIKKYKLIFSAQENNFDSFSFHEICSKDVTNTLILIKTEDNDIIGGFTFASWEPNSLISYDDKAFVFNLNKKQKFRITNPSSAINSRINEGPIFGMYDLIINGNKMKVQEKMESYGNNNLGIKNDVVKILNYEVFNVIFE